jgi:hypothetical protein
MPEVPAPITVGTKTYTWDATKQKMTCGTRGRVPKQVTDAVIAYRATLVAEKQSQAASA